MVTSISLELEMLKLSVIVIFFSKYRGPYPKFEVLNNTNNLNWKNL